MNIAKIRPAEIGFDFDGVIADTVEAFIRIACEQYGHCGIRPADITDFSVEQCLDMDAGLAESIFLQILHDSVGTGLLPMPGAVAVLDDLTGHGQVTIVTARPDAEPVHHWLHTVFPAQARRRIRVVARCRWPGYRALPKPHRRRYPFAGSVAPPHRRFR